MQRHRFDPMSKPLSRRARARIKTGLCAVMTCESDRVTTQYCRPHQDKANRKAAQATKRRMKAMLCRACGIPTDTKHQLCTRCLTKQRDAKRVRRAFRRANRLCVQCGVPVTKGYSMCMKHRAASAAWWAPRPPRTPEQTQASARHAGMVRWHGRDYSNGPPSSLLTKPQT